MNLPDYYMEYALQWLTACGVSEDLLERCQDYILHQGVAADVLPLLPENDLSDAQFESVWQEIGNSYFFLRTHKPNTSRLFQILYRIGGVAMLEPLGTALRVERGQMLTLIYVEEGAAFAPVLLDYLGDSSQAVREIAAELLAKHRELDDRLAEMLFHKLKHVREAVAQTIYMWGDAKGRALLEQAYEKERNQGVKYNLALFLGYIAGEVRKDSEALPDMNSLQTKEQIVEYCTRQLKRIRKQYLNWLDLEQLPILHFAEDGEAAPDAVRQYLMISLAEQTQPGPNLEASTIHRFLQESDVQDLARATFEAWVQAEYEAKKKWVITLAVFSGDSQLLHQLETLVEAWPKQKRGALSSYALRVMALTGGQEPLLLVNTFRRKSKIKLVKEGAEESFLAAAGALGLDVDGLTDRMVPTLGFDAAGEQVLDYGTRTFRLRLTPTLDLVVVDERGKQFKNLPKPSQKDDEAQAEAAKEFFKALKKQLRALYKAQAARYELAMVKERMWTRELWSKLFVENPILMKFATALLWGLYEEGALQQSFRYLADGTCRTLDGATFEAQEGSVIGLVHPLEITEEERVQWLRQFEADELKAPFEQLSRLVYHITDEERAGTQIERYHGVTISSHTLFNRLTKLGWSKGLNQDGGVYFDFYKDDQRLRVGAQLDHHGIRTDSTDEGADVTVTTLRFYRATTIKRGSYLSDGNPVQNLILPGDVPPRLFSEVLYEVELALTHPEVERVVVTS
ncbi:DUF4132 domain-containing protein [Tumebacillus permanentifrigoris]|uniref:Uncharacterized protein DUF4132 n=1 Tax=Tumebacillus permanentifrigoris TaxID=378543 RepID=A0A316DC39_9BACL|nr:DUF4132 domain-containing protein [Tumebacillus permanentifrigoris]PWK15771.1 uncharacterized protein DUF4132 [Tumebacillus permanentifrigoris]